MVLPGQILTNEHIPMKTGHIVLSAVGVLLFACNKQTLDKETAEKLITAEYKLPKIVNYNISAADPDVAKKLLDLGLENAGLVKITRRQTLSQMGTPWIHFTSKGKTYFLPTSDEDVKYMRQNIRAAVEEFGEITGIIMGKENKTGIVKFSLVYKDPTPFSKLLANDLSKPQVLDAFFIKYDSGWKLDNKKGKYILMGF